MSYNRTMKQNRGESIGTVDGAFDDDRPASHDLIRDDAACAIPWLGDGFEAVQVYIDPALVDRQAEICSAVDGVCAAHRDIDGLSAAIATYADGAGLSAGIYERPADALSENTVAVVFTIG